MTEESGKYEVEGSSEKRASNLRRKYAVGVAAQALREGWVLDESFCVELADILD